MNSSGILLSIFCKVSGGLLQILIQDISFCACMWYFNVYIIIFRITRKIVGYSGCAPVPQVSVSAAYWLVNRTGLPLVFRAEGGGEAAGQFAEHELARMVAPLPFAFADGDGPTVSARLGTSLAGSAEVRPRHLSRDVTLSQSNVGREHIYFNNSKILYVIFV